MPFTCSPRPRSSPRPALLAAATLAAAALAGAAAAPASAAGFTCDASALRGSILGQPAVEPITAGRGSARCTTATAGGDVALPGLPVAATALSAKTYATPAGTANDKQGAFASGGLAGLTVKTLPTLPIAVPTASIPPELLTLQVPLDTLLSQVPGLGAALNLVGGSVGSVGGVVCTATGTVGGAVGGGVLGGVLGVPCTVTTTVAGTVINLPDTLTFDLKSLIDQLLPDGKLPNVDLLSFGAASAFAGGRCQNGVAETFGSSQVADLKVLGEALPVDQVLSSVVTLLDTGNVDLSSIDVSRIGLPADLAPEVVAVLQPLLSQIQTAVLKPLIDALPTISIPATVANVKVTPGSQTIRADGTLVQQGPRVQASILGQPLLDVVIGEATMGGAATVNCVVPAATPPPVTAADLALQCTTRRLVLVDVLSQNGRVKLLGAADRKLAGKRIGLRLRANGRTVATAKVRSDGSFSATAPLPAMSIRGTDKARYQAYIGKEKSLDLKLTRRMLVSSVTSSSGRVTLKGRVVLPLAKSVASITLTRRLSCKTSEVVKRFKPKSNGAFSVTVDAPDDATAAVYRMSTSVRRTTKSPSTSKTFTLPRGVNLDK